MEANPYINIHAKIYMQADTIRVYVIKLYAIILNCSELRYLCMEVCFQYMEEYIVH